MVHWKQESEVDKKNSLLLLGRRFRLLGLGKVVIRSIHTPGPLRTFVSGDLTRVERDDSDESSMTPMSKHIAFHWRGAHSLT